MIPVGTRVRESDYNELGTVIGPDSMGPYDYDVKLDSGSTLGYDEDELTVIPKVEDRVSVLGGGVEVPALGTVIHVNPTTSFGYTVAFDERQEWGAYMGCFSVNELTVVEDERITVEVSTDELNPDHFGFNTYVDFYHTDDDEDKPAITLDDFIAVLVTAEELFPESVDGLRACRAFVAEQYVLSNNDD